MDAADATAEPFALGPLQNIQICVIHGRPEDQMVGSSTTVPGDPTRRERRTDQSGE
jgi:hypothetical protein